MSRASQTGVTVRSTALIALLVCALFLRIAIPAGWMPMTDASGFHLVMCSGMGPMGPGEQRAMPVAGHDGHGKSHDEGGDHPCTFAGIGLAMAQPFLPTLVTPPIARTISLDTMVAAAGIGRGLAAPPPPQTGPPLPV